MKILGQCFNTKIEDVFKPEGLRWTFGMVSFLVIGVFIVWFYMQNLRGETEALSMTVFKSAIVLCSIGVAIVITCRNKEATWWIAGIFVVLFVSSFFSWSSWEELRGGTESLSTTIRNIGLLTGGCVAIILALWRSMVGERQATTAKFSALNDRYERATESLGSDVLWVRLGGINSLQRLAEDYPEQYHIHVMQLLCAFVRKPIGDEVIVPVTSGPLRDDIQNAMTAIGRRDKSRIQLERIGGFELNLRAADLRRVQLRGSNLSNAILDNANLSEAILIGADLSRVSLWQTNLSSVLCAEPLSEEEDASRSPVQGLTQKILNEACADTDKPLRELSCAHDAESGTPLRWCGGPC